MTNNSINTSIPIEVTKGGTQASSFVAYAPIVGGVTSTGALQSVASAGTAGQFLVSGGPSALPTWQTGGGGGGGFTQIATQIITSSGTYTPSAGLVQAMVYLTAGGGRGGNGASTTSNTSSAGSGGGGGETRIGIFTSTQIGSSVPVTIGQGATTPVDGGDSAFGSLMTAKGGKSGFQGNALGYNMTNAASGGTGGSGGFIAMPGQNGSPGLNYEGAVGTTSVVVPGQGGNSYFGQGGYATGGFNSGTASAGIHNGSSGVGYGSGGGGGASYQGGGTGSGGSGANGVCVIIEYIA